MQTFPELIPPPPLVRQRIADHIREGRLLRALLRVSVQAAEERHRKANLDSRQPAPGLEARA